MTCHRTIEMLSYTTQWSDKWWRMPKSIHYIMTGNPLGNSWVENSYYFVQVREESAQFMPAFSREIGVSWIILLLAPVFDRPLLVNALFDLEFNWILDLYLINSISMWENVRGLKTT